MATTAHKHVHMGNKKQQNVTKVFKVTTNWLRNSFLACLMNITEYSS